jgi:hypothetical protein
MFPEHSSIMPVAIRKRARPIPTIIPGLTLTRILSGKEQHSSRPLLCNGRIRFLFVEKEIKIIRFYTGQRKFLCPGPCKNRQNHAGSKGISSLTETCRSV